MIGTQLIPTMNGRSNQVPHHTMAVTPARYVAYH